MLNHGALYGGIGLGGKRIKYPQKLDLVHARNIS